MRRITILILAGFGLSLLGAPVLQAGRSATSGALLEEKFSPRAEGMGEAQTALPVDEMGALGWNPAGLFLHYYQQAGAVYLRGIYDHNLGSVFYSQTFGPQLSLGGALHYNDAGSFEVNDSIGFQKQVAAQRDILGAATGAYQADLLGQDVFVGANVKLLHSNLLEEYSAFTAALDIGAVAELLPVQENLFLGLAVRNVGLPLKYLEQAAPLPLTLLAGAAYKILPTGQHQVTAALDGSFDAFNGLLRANLGLEYWYQELLALRAGYKLGYDLDSLSLGAGLHFRQFRLDYAFGLMNDLNSTHKVSFTYDLSQDEQRRQDVQLHYTRTPTPTFTITPTPTQTPLWTPTPTPAPARKPTALGPAVLQPSPTVAGTPLPPIMAKIVELELAGGLLKAVILDVGANRKIRPGCEGLVFNASGYGIAKIKIMEIYPRFSRASIIESSGEVTAQDRVEIYQGRAP